MIRFNRNVLMEKALPWALVFLQIGKTLLFFRGVDLSLSTPLLNVDFSFYYSGALKIHELLTRSGRAWGYDPFQMAGYPFVTSFSGSGYLFALGAHWMSGFLSIGRSLLLLEFLVMLSFPFLAWLAVFVWSGDKNFSWTMFFVVTLTQGIVEPLSRLFIEKGLFPYQWAVFTVFCQVAFFWRWVRENTWRNWGLQTFFSVLAPMIHSVAK